MERLQKVIANSGYTSRRKAEELILKGKVTVNGEVVRELGTKVGGNDTVLVEGNVITTEDKVYFLLNKPSKTISSVKDEKNRMTVVDLIDTDKRIYPVGRLDYDTTGLLILTNDGELSNILMHPKGEVEKTYVAKLNKVISVEDIIKLKHGILIDKVKCYPTRVKVRKTDKTAGTSTVEISIVEGRNHIVKKVFNELGYKVIKLNRTQYGFLTLTGLDRGNYRTLTIKEVKKLYEYKN